MELSDWVRSVGIDRSVSPGEKKSELIDRLELELIAFVENE